VQALVSNLMQFARSVVDVGVRMEGLRAAFTTVTGSSQAGARQLAFVREEAQRLSLDVTVLQERFLKMTAAAQGTTLQGAEVQRLFSAMASAARVLNLSSEQTKLSFVALEQIMSKGKLSSEELRRQLWRTSARGVPDSCARDGCDDLAA
jgi:phage tail tape-measure protein